MVDSLVAFDSFDKFFGDVGVHPYQKYIVEVVFFVVELVVKIFMDEVEDERVLCF
jgi:hypothetical protein